MNVYPGHIQAKTNKWKLTSTKQICMAQINISTTIIIFVLYTMYIVCICILKITLLSHS